MARRSGRDSAESLVCWAIGRVRFHNTAPCRYLARVSIRPRSRLLDRLRRSARLAALVLLVFAMKIASTTACVTHDYASAGGSDDHAAVVQAVETGDDAASSSLHAAICTHCGCHQASALPAGLAILSIVPSRDPLAYRPGAPPRPSPRQTLRPPIV